MSDEEIAARIRDHVLAQVEKDEIQLPALPRVAARCLGLLAQPDYSLREVGAVIETDPLVAARLVRVANSAYFAGTNRLTSTLECVTRLGADEMRIFLLETAARQLHQSNDKRIGELGKRLWEHSVAVGIFARMLVNRTEPRLSESAYLAGLLHDVGKPIVAAMLLEAERRLLGTRTQSWILPETWLRLIEAHHRPVGLALSDKWNLPPIVAQTIRDGSEYDLSEPRSVANAVLFAFAVVSRQGIGAEAPDPEEADRLVRTGRELFDLADRPIEPFLEALRKQLQDRLR